MQQSASTALAPTILAILRGPSPLSDLWRGTLPSTLRTGLGSALYFSSLNALRERVALLSASSSSRSLHSTRSTSSSLPTLSNTANLLTGALARATVGTLLMPITVMKVRFESDIYAYRSLAGAAGDIYRRSGIRGFFAGVGATAARDAPYAGLYVLFYEQCKRRLGAVVAAPARISRGETREKQLGGGRVSQLARDVQQASMDARTAAGVNFASGVVAAGVATALTNPFDAIKTRLQLMPREYRGMWQAGRRIVREEGPRALMDGLGLRMVRKGLSSALAWTVYEEVVRWGRGEDAGK